MKLIVFGATGTIGQKVVEQALAQGHKVSAFVRDPAKLAMTHDSLVFTQGDVLDSVAVEQAIQGQDAVICVLGSGKQLKSQIRSEGTRTIIKAMEKTGVRRLICQSTLGAGESWANLNFYWKYVMFGFILRHVFADHEVQEMLVKQSRLDWTIVRPGAFIDGPSTGEYLHGFSSGDRNLKLEISRADVADFLLKQVQSNQYLLQTPGLSY